MTKLEKVYIFNLARKLKKVDSVSKSFTSADLKKYFEKYLNNKTLGVVFKISSKDFLEIIELAGFRIQRVIKGSPNFYMNVCNFSINKLFGSLM